MKVNRFQPDPITNRSMSDDCWDGKHWAKRTTKDKHGEKHIVEVGCTGYRESGAPCNCHCHSRQARVAVRRQDQQAQTMDIMDTGCGTIDVK